MTSDANREVLAILPVDGPADRDLASLGIILQPPSDSSELADVFLLGNNGQTLAKVNDTDLPQVTRLTDLNRDGYFELLLARFATLQLFGLGDSVLGNVTSTFGV